MWLLLAWCIRLAGSQVCRPPDLGPQSEAFVNIEDVLVNQLDADGVMEQIFPLPNVPHALWGQTCATLSAGCVRYLADKLGDAAEQDGVAQHRKLMYRQAAFFLTSDICFDDADESLLDSRLLAVLLVEDVPAFSHHFLDLFSYLQTQHSPGSRAVHSHEVVRVTTLGVHASLVLEVRTMWEKYVAGPLIFDFNDVSLDTKRCQDANCLLSPTMHPSFLRLAENMEHLGALGEPVMLEMDRLLPELVAAVLDYRPDIAVCTHPPFLCRILHALAQVKGVAVIGFFGGNIEAMVHVDELADWVRELHDMAQAPNVRLFTNSAFLSVKIFAMSGAVTKHLPVFGLGTDMVWNPQRPEVLVWKSSNQCCDNVERFWSRVVATAASVQLQYAFQHLKLLRSQGAAGYDAVATYQAVVMFPYDVVLLSFFELYHAAMPIFAPDIYSSAHYVWRGSINAPRYGDDQPDLWTIRPGWPRDWAGLKRELGVDFDDHGIDLHPRHVATDARVRFFWAHGLELYSYPHVQYFSSFADLILDLKEANLPAISAGMQLHSRKNLQAAARFWRVSLMEMLVYNAEPQAAENRFSVPNPE